MIIDLIPEHEEIVRRNVESGEYMDASDVICAAIRQMNAGEAFRRLERAIAENAAVIESGDGVGISLRGMGREEGRDEH